MRTRGDGAAPGSRGGRAWVAAWAVAAGLAGCGGTGEGLYPVSGKVTYKGEPAAGAVVTFRPRATPTDGAAATSPGGVVADDGSFSLSSGLRGGGAAPGEYDVLIEWRDDSAGPGATAGPAAKPAKGASREPRKRRQDVDGIAPDKLQGKYFATPRFTAQVKAESNTLPPYDLQD